MSLMDDRKLDIEIYIGDPDRQTTKRETINGIFVNEMLVLPPTEHSLNLLSYRIFRLLTQHSDTVLRRENVPCHICRETTTKRSGHRVAPILKRMVDPSSGKMRKPYIVDIMLPICDSEECYTQAREMGEGYLRKVLPDGYDLGLAFMPCAGCGHLGMLEEYESEPHTFYCVDCARDAETRKNRAAAKLEKAKGKGLIR